MTQRDLSRSLPSRREDIRYTRRRCIVVVLVHASHVANASAALSAPDHVTLLWPRADFRKSFFEICGGVRKGESFAKVAILQYSASTGNGGQDPFLSTLRVYTRSYSPDSPLIKKSGVSE